MNKVSWNIGGTNGVGGVPGATNYTYVTGSDLLAGISTARTDGAYTPVTASYTYEDKRDVKTQVLNKAIDEVRAKEAKDLVAKGLNPVLKKTRWLFLKRPENLTETQDTKLADILRINL